MMVSTKGRYALLVMIDLAQHEGEGQVSLKDISLRQGVSLKYLESIVALLKEARLVLSSRGKDGGYKLSRASSEIFISEIIRATEGTLSMMACPDCSGDEHTCERADVCLTLPLWVCLEQVIDRYLKSISLKDLLEGKIPTK